MKKSIIKIIVIVILIALLVLGITVKLKESSDENLNDEQTNVLEKEEEPKNSIETPKPTEQTEMGL